MSNLRSVKVTYANGDVIRANMAAGLTDQQIKDYYKVGSVFNLGRVRDNLTKVTKVEIIA